MLYMFPRLTQDNARDVCFRGGEPFRQGLPGIPCGMFSSDCTNILSGQCRAAVRLPARHDCLATGNPKAVHPPLVDRVVAIVGVGSSGEMTPSRQKHTANFVVAGVVIPDAARIVTGMKNESFGRERCSKRVRIAVSRDVCPAHHVGAIPSLAVAANPRPTTLRIIQLLDMRPEAFLGRDFPVVTVQESGGQTLDGQAASARAERKGGSIMEHRSYPFGEPRAVATVPGHSCANYIRSQD